MDWTWRRPAVAAMASAVLVLGARMASAAPDAVFTAAMPKTRVPALMAATECVRALPEDKLLALVPTQSGLHFVGCANCKSGTQQNQLAWNPERPDEVYCRFCGQRYPSDKYPMDAAATVTNPLGQEQRYPYWADAKGNRCYFAARRDDLVTQYLADRARDLAQLYSATGDRTYARRAGLLLVRFAEVFPGWGYHHDYPNRPQELYSGDVPAAKRGTNYRTARWTWWAYMDIPIELVEAYDRVRGSGVLADIGRERGYDASERIERDLLRNAAEEVLADEDDYTNMSPSCWRTLVLAGRVLGEPRYIHEVARRLLRFVDARFFYDGTWPEASPDYAAQTVGGLERVVDAMRGFKDPAGYHDAQDPPDAPPFSGDITLPELAKSRAILDLMRLPDGRSLPINDTWPTSKHEPTKETKPYLLPALGHACLGGGAGAAQTQFHLRWAGGYGHDHEDLLGIIVYANGREQLSDLGYTHTRYRSWTEATASHNTVVIDQKGQRLAKRDAPTDGRLLFYDTADPRVQVVSADGTRAYSGVADTYRRTLVAIDAGDGSRYAVDAFEVGGGSTHDYFLHGDASEPASVIVASDLQPLSSLMPPSLSWRSPANESDNAALVQPGYAYGFLRNLRAADVPAGAPLAVRFASPDGAGPALRVTLLPEAGSQTIVGEDPSIRQAKEDDAKLDQFTRPFVALRHQAAGGKSVFGAVLEPYANAPFLTSVQRLAVPGATLALRIRRGARTDLVVVGAAQPVALPMDKGRATFSGAVGVLTLAGDQVEHAYALGGAWTCGDLRLEAPAPQKRDLVGVADGALVVSGPADGAPAPGSVVRVVTADGWVYPFTVASTEPRGDALAIRVIEGPGLASDGKALRLTAFPQREHTGAVTVQWMVSASK